MSLNDWAKSGWLKPQKPARSDRQNLQRGGLRPGGFQAAGFGRQPIQHRLQRRPLTLRDFVARRGVASRQIERALSDDHGAAGDFRPGTAGRR